MPEDDLFRFSARPTPRGPGPLHAGAAASVPRPSAQTDMRAGAALFRASCGLHGGEDFAGGPQAKLRHAIALLKTAYNAQAPEALFGNFTPFLKQEIGLPALRSAFREMQDVLGRMTAIGAPRPAASLTAEVPARFDHGAMTVTLTIESTGRIDGLLMEQA